MSARRNTLDDARMGHVRLALCCECGNVRSAAARGGRRNGTTMGWTPEQIAEHRAKETMPKASRAYWESVVPFERWLEDLKCEACGKVTRHAAVWPEGHPDEAEAHNRTGHDDAFTAGAMSRGIKIVTVPTLTDRLDSVWVPEARLVVLREGLSESEREQSILWAIDRDRER